MGAPTVKFYINTGSESTPTWTEVTGTQAFFLAGPDTTGSVLDPISAPLSGTKFPEELWKGVSASYASGVQCSTYEQAIGSAVNTNVFAVQFDTNPTSTAPELTAWDDTNRNSNAQEIFVGTTGSAYDLLRAVITASDVAPAAGAGTLPAGWGTQIISTTTYMLLGNTYKQTAASAITAGNQFRFVSTVWIPYDILEGFSGHTPIISCKYTFV